MEYVSNNGLISIIMPSYNTGKYIGDSIKSVLEQTYEDWELLIVDDDSSDDTLKVIESYNDSRIKVFLNNKHYGAAYSRNKAIKEAKGKWIAFLDSDDLWMPEKLEKQLDFMVTNNIHFSYHNYEQIDESGKRKHLLVTGPKRISSNDMLNYDWVGCLTAMYDAEFVGRIQIENILRTNDYAMWLKIIQKCNCYLLDENLALYRKGRSGSLSNTDYGTLIKWHFKLFHDVERLSMLSSLNHTLRNIVFGIYKKLIFEKHV